MWTSLKKYNWPFLTEFQKVLRLSTPIGTVRFESMKRNNFCLMASKDRCYHQRKNSRTHLPKIVHYAYTVVQLSSSPGSGLFCSLASVVLCSSVTASRFIWLLLQTRDRVRCNMQGGSLYSSTGLILLIQWYKYNTTLHPGTRHTVRSAQ